MNGQFDHASSTARGVYSAFPPYHFPDSNLPPSLLLEGTVSSMEVGKGIVFYPLELIIHSGRGKDLEEKNIAGRKG